MFAPGGGEFGANAAAAGAVFESPELAALASALGRLIVASDGVADAVTRHDRLALTRCNEDAEALVGEVNALTARLSELDRTLLEPLGIPAMCARLVAGARRNAYLIERAWAVDAALIRLLMGLGRVAADGTVGGYSANPGPACVDRQA